MPKNFSDLQRRQLDARIAAARAMSATPPPRNGWIRAMRQALDMSQPQLAARLKLKRQSVNGLEKAEAAGKISLASLHRAAAALGCRLSYALVPNDGSISATRRRRAEAIAARELQSVIHSMHLEDQGVPARELKRQKERLVDELLHGSGRRLWR